MGFKENLLLSLKGYTIEYQGKKLYVVEEVEHEGNKYLYTINEEKAPNAEINFLKKETDTIYENVESKELFDILLAKVGVKALEKEAKNNDNV